MRGEVSEQVFETWLRPLRFVAREGPILFVATPHKFFKEWIEENHLGRIEEIARKELAEEVTVEIMVGIEEEDPLSPIPAASRLLHLPEETATRTRAVFGPLNSRYTFDRFVIGTGNKYAPAARHRKCGACEVPAPQGVLHPRREVHQRPHHLPALRKDVRLQGTIPQRRHAADGRRTVY